MKRALIVIIVALFIFEGKAQNHFNCGFDEAVIIAENKYPSLVKKQENAIKNYHKYLNNYIQNKGNKSPEIKYRIPVVVHLMHQYGTVYNDFLTNKNKYKLAIEDINAHFRNEDSLSIELPFNEISPNLNVEFVLAKLDPQGKPTEGFTLNYLPIGTAVVGAEERELKSIEQWDNHKYLNIWIIPDIEEGNVAGYAHYPGIPDDLDGVVMVNGELYVLGGLNGLAHECGHWLGLKHTWGPFPYGDRKSSCGFDDGIFDTPNTEGQRSFWCNEGNITCTDDPMPFKDISGKVIWAIDKGQIHDNTQNIMDYGFCTYENFTEGQKVFVRSTLATNPNNGRDSIWIEKNLISTGVCDTCGPYLRTPIAEFSIRRNRACVGEEIQFSDASYNAIITKWLWDFGDGTTDTVQNPLHFFQIPGTFDITLTSINANGSSLIKKKGLITIGANVGVKKAPFYEDFEDNNFPILEEDMLERWVVENGHTSASWERKEGVSATGGASFGLNLNGIADFEGKTFKYSIVSPMIDFTTSDCNKLSYKWAYAKRFSRSADFLRVKVNMACGDGSWMEVYSVFSDSMGTASSDVVQVEYKPKTSEFRTNELNLNAFKDENHLLIKFEIETGGGNYFYIDDINIGCDTQTSILEKEKFNLTIYPNPYDESAAVSLSLDKSRMLNLIITNIVGEKLYQKKSFFSIGNHTLQLNELLGEVKKGVYFITIKSENVSVTKKVIKL